MKPEPLKGKKHTYTFRDMNTTNYTEADVKAAVEWLKDKVNKNYKHSGVVKYFIELIDEAFADIMEEKK